MEQIDEKLRTLQPVLGRMKTKRLRQMYFLEDNYRQKKEIESHLDLLISRFVKKEIEEEIILPPPEKELCQGDIEIGDVEYPGKKLHPFKLQLRDVNRHLGIFGATGSGKTTFAKNVIRQLYKRNIPFLIFDWEKNYRTLIHEFPDVQVFTVGSDIHPLFLNFLTVPPGIKYDEYIKSIIAVISEDYVGGIGADTMLLNYIEMAYEETKNPFFEDLKQIIAREIGKDMGRKGRLSGRSGLWKETVSRQITFLSKGSSGSVVNPRKHFPLEQLFTRPIVLEFGNLKSIHDRKFFIHVILNWLSIYNQHHGIRSEELRQVLIFEEFHNIAMKGKEDNMISTFFRESRKYGIGLIAIDQTPSEIPNAIFANMNAKISFALGTNRDVQAMARAMNLDHLKSKYLGMLKTGQAVINVKQRHHDSFLIKTPFIKQKENIWDEELREAMKKFADITTPEKPITADPGNPRSPQRQDTLTPLERVLLADIIERPFDGVDGRTKRLGLHPSIMATLHASLSEKGFIDMVYLDRKKLFQVTEHGKTVAESADIPIPGKETKGGMEHSYWIHQTIRFLKKLGFQPACEVKGIDIIDTKMGVAIEVETGKSDLTANMEKLRKSRFPNCFMLATGKPVEIKLKNLTRDFPPIRVLFVKDFLKLTEEQILSLPQKTPLQTPSQNPS